MAQPIWGIAQEPGSGGRLAFDNRSTSAIPSEQCHQDLQGFFSTVLEGRFPLQVHPGHEERSLGAG